MRDRGEPAPKGVRAHRSSRRRVTGWRPRPGPTPRTPARTIELRCRPSRTQETGSLPRRAPRGSGIPVRQRGESRAKPVRRRRTGARSTRSAARPTSAGTPRPKAVPHAIGTAAAGGCADAAGTPRVSPRRPCPPPPTGAGARGFVRRGLANRPAGRLASRIPIRHRKRLASCGSSCVGLARVNGTTSRPLRSGDFRGCRRIALPINPEVHTCSANCSW